MDKTAAKNFARKLVGETLDGWKIVSYINCGKSAIVLKAAQAGQLAAIKVFDPELVKSHGLAIQKERINREKSLVGKNHPNLVCILGGGRWKAKKLYYIIMEFLPWKNLADALTSIPVGLERSVISQVAAAAKFLEDLQICHRDIKPENIGISDDFKTVKLLDLGVLRPMGARSITDGTHSKVFVGTLKYSPPEFLLRQENDSVDSWRAVTFYQLGGVLHDLIMRTTLFKEFETPYAQLVNAVQHQRPVIESKSVPPALVDLAKHCLLKPPELRLKLVTWKDFEKEPEQHDTTAELKARILKRNLVSSSSSGDGGASEEAPSAEERLRQYARDVENTCRLECIDNKDVFPPIEIHTENDGNNRKRVILQFDPSPTHGLGGHLRLDIIVESVDPVNNVGTIYAKACLQSAASDYRIAQKSPEQKLFTGIYSETVRASIAATLYKALDLAQDMLKSTKPHKGASYSHALNLEDESHMNETWWVKPSQLDSKQGAVIDLDLGKSHLLLGPPGSGKTNLLLLRASQMVRSNKPNVLILIFTRELREFIATGTDNYAFANDKITTSIGWMRSFLWTHGIKSKEFDKFEELRIELTRQVKELIHGANLSNIYDAIILDEAQDYLPDEIDIFLQLGAVVFAAADSRQRIYTSASYDLKALETKLGAAYHLKHHYRNGREICRLADALAKPWGDLEPLLPTCNYDEARNPSTIEIVPSANLDEQVQKAVQKLETQLKAYPDEMLAVLCPSRKSLKAIAKLLSQTSVAEKLVVQSAEDGYTAFDETKQVCVSTIYGAKGLEFRAVHLMEAELIKRSPLNRNIAYTAVTRAKTSLSIYHTDSLPAYIESALSTMKEPVKPAKLNQLFGGS